MQQTKVITSLQNHGEIPLHTHRMAKMEKKTTANVGRDIEPLECLFVVGSVKCYNYFGKHFSKMLNIVQFYYQIFI